jgi:hypothetical protein
LEAEGSLRDLGGGRGELGICVRLDLSAEKPWRAVGNWPRKHDRALHGSLTLPCVCMYECVHVSVRMYACMHVYDGMCTWAVCMYECVHMPACVLWHVPVGCMRA